MSDIKCAVCREPWDAYGMRHGDMAPWEYDLFKKGAGCPCCKGVAPSNGADNTEAHLKSVVFNDEDPDSYALLHTPDAPRPKWERPADEIKFECPGCGAKLTRDVDFSATTDPDLALEWSARSPNSYRCRDWPLDLDELHEVDGKRYCPSCVVMCAGDDCTNIIFTSSTSASGQVLFGDTYDAGASHADPRDPHHGGSICTACLEAIPTCSHCSEPLGDDEETDEDGRGECCAEPAEAEASEEA